MRFNSMFLALPLLIVSSLPGQISNTLILKDGRTIEAPTIQKGGDDSYLLVYPHGEVKVPKNLVLRAFIFTGSTMESSIADASAGDKKKLSKGLVPFEGKWISQKKLHSIMAKRSKKRRKDLNNLKAHSQWRSRYKSSTKHFIFEYTLPPEVAQNYMFFFEAYWKVFNKRWKIKQPPRPGKLKVCMYSKEADFLRIANVPKGVLGYFKFVEPLELNFFHDRRDPRFTLAVLWHEANHYFMHLYVQKGIQNPGWLEEGLAEYFGGSSWDPKTKKMTPGLIQEGRLVNLQDAMDGKDFQKFEPLMRQQRINALQYAWSWSMVHMLFNTKKYERGFKKFIFKMAHPKKLKKEAYGGQFLWVSPDAQIKLFKKLLGIKDLKSLEKEWYAYIRKMKVKSARGYYRAAHFCKRWNRPIRAGVYFKKALEIDPKYLPTYEAYASHLFDQDKLVKAREIIEKGLTLDPINPGFFLLLAKIEKENKKPLKTERYCLLATELAPDDVDVRWSAQMILEK